MSAFNVSKTVLNDSDRMRIVAIFLNSPAYNSKLNQVDWEQAAKDFGSASANSFRTCHSAALKKLRVAIEKQDESGATGGSASDGKVSGSATSTPRKQKGAGDANQTPKRGRKRKSDGEVDMATPSKKRDFKDVSVDKGDNKSLASGDLFDHIICSHHDEEDEAIELGPEDFGTEV